MLDFTSALYLGLGHPSRSLRPWQQLTAGVPAALRPTPGARDLARRLATLVGCEAALLGASTLHLFWDLFGLAAKDGVAVFADADLYPIVRWGVERAAARGAPVRTFPHHDPEALGALLRRHARGGRRPLVVTEGLCPGCGGRAPLGAYLELVRRYGGRLVLDDTQALGLLGRGGGGSLTQSGITAPEAIVVDSLAKGFGVPLAVLAASPELVSRFADLSETRVHCSPPSVAAVRAGERALDVNEELGDLLRRRLAQRIRYFRGRLAGAGLRSAGGFFPVQTLRPSHARQLHRRLLSRGIRAVLQRPRCGNGPRISFLITARHRPSDIDRVMEVLERP